VIDLERAPIACQEEKWSLLAVITDQGEMIKMSELAFNANGESFEIPATVTGWRVRRMKPRGAPELVYGQDGRPLTVGIEADIDEVRDAVGTAGKYRLDPINDDGKCVENVPAAYVHVVKPERALVPAASAAPASDDTVREAMRLNTELAKSVIDRFPEMMHAAAELLRAADGAGLPARTPREIDSDDSDDEEIAPTATASPSFELLNTLVAQIVPLLINGMAGKKMPQLAAILDWRKAQPKADPQAQDAAPASAQSTALPPLDPKMMGHFIAIQSALAPGEAAFARQLAAELSPAEMRAWFDELAALSVPDAVTKIRPLLSSMKAGGAS
jgi:hypothetical protein